MALGHTGIPPEYIAQALQQAFGGIGAGIGAHYGEQAKQQALAKALMGAQGQVGGGTGFGGSPELAGQTNTGTPGLLGNLDPRLVQAAILAGPAAVAQLVGNAAKGAEPYTLGTGDVRFGANNQPVATGPAAQPKAPTTRDIMRGDQRVFQEWDPATGAFKDISSGPAFAPTSPAVVMSPGDTETQKLVAKRQEVDLPAEVDSINAQLGPIQAMQDLIKSGNVDTGAGSPWRVYAKEALGLDAATPSEQLFNALSNQTILAIKQTQKGPQTDRDEATIRQATASLGKGNVPNAAILDLAQQAQTRRLHELELESHYLAENGTRVGFDKQLRQYREANPLRFSAPAEAPVATQAGAAPSTSAPDISRLNAIQLQALDLSTLSEEQLRAASDRYNALGLAQ